MKNLFLTKTVAVLAIVLLLWGVLLQIGNLGAERQSRQQEAQYSIETSQAGRQSLLGPVIQSACVEEWDTVVGEGAARKTGVERRAFMQVATPAQLKVQAHATMEPRYRGIFKVNTYVTQATMTGRWTGLSALSASRQQAGSRLSCGAPTVMVAVTDARGIRQALVKVNGQALAVQPGTVHGSHPRGFHAELPEPLRAAGAPLAVEVSMVLIGTAELAVAPVADDTQVRLTSDWPHPSFGGRFLPTEREVQAQGFSATWQVSALATTAPMAMARGNALCDSGGGVYLGGSPDDASAETANGCIETFNVSFKDPVNTYSLSDRAVKYGLLFVGLTFVAVGLVEVMRRLRVHPVQYLFVGFALSMFFLLLLSLSEHLSFALSYALAGTACVSLLTAYASYLLGGWRGGLGFGAGVGFLYGVLYVLLQMEQTALVIGSLLLFAVLAAVMMLTRRLDWYGLLRREPASDARGG